MGSSTLTIEQPHPQPPGPQHVVPGENKVHVRVRYDPDEGEDCPNDVHVAYAELSPFKHDEDDWIKVFDAPDVVAAGGVDAMVCQVVFQFRAPPPGTYDIRVQWTRKVRNEAGAITETFIRGSEKIGEFYVDPR